MKGMISEKVLDKSQSAVTQIELSSKANISKPNFKKGTGLSLEPSADAELSGKVKIPVSSSAKWTGREGNDVKVPPELLNKVICGDCLEVMKKIPDNSVDLVVTDPPYFKIMLKDWEGKKHDWDNQWASFQNYLNWLNSIVKECKRVLKDNGSFYIFCDDKLSGYIQVECDKFNWVLLNHIIWYKRNNLPIKGWALFRSFAPCTEHILFYGNPESEYVDGCDGLKKHLYSKIRKYFIEEKNKVGITLDDVNILVGTASMAGRHYFADSQWCFPIQEHYERMQLTFNAVYKKIVSVEEAGKMTNEQLANLLAQNYDVLRQNYDELRQNYDELRQNYDELRQNYDELRRYFHQSENFTDVWDIPIMNNSESVEHPTQKPLELIKRIIKCSSDNHDIVLDCFHGSGTTAVAAKMLGRNFIGIELSSEYCKIAEKRIASVQPNTEKSRLSGFIKSEVNA